MRSSSRRLKRRSPLWRAAMSPTRHCTVAIASSTRRSACLLLAEQVVLAQHRDELGLPAERVAEQPAGTEDAAGPLGRAGTLPERSREVPGAGGPLGETPELEQREIGIR